MSKNVIISAHSGPTSYNWETNNIMKHIALGIKYDVNNSNNTIDDNIMSEMLAEVKKLILDTNNANLNSEETSSEMVIITDEFFDYIQNTNVKISPVRVSLEDYEIVVREQKLKTIRTKFFIINADPVSISEMFDSAVKELYYEFGNNKINLYSVILAPVTYKIVNNVPIQYRNILIRVEK